MHIYNVTTNVEEDVHDEWLTWMKEEHIPAMMATGKFTEALMSRVLVNEKMGGITYSTQFKTKDMATLKQYYVEDSKELLKKEDRFKNKAVSFRTEMEIIDQQ